MPNLFKTGATFLADQSEAHLSETIIYTRKAESWPGISAVVTAPQTNTGDDVGSVFNADAADFIFKTSAIPFRPQAGDEITYGGSRYRVVNDDTEDAYRYSDPFKIRYRVHTQIVGLIND